MATFSREIDLIRDDAEVILSIFQRTVGGVDCVVWDAALAFSKFVERNPDLMFRKTDLQNSDSDGGLANAAAGDCNSNLRILELGAGTGVCGVVCGVYGYHVTITDLPQAMDLIRANIKENESLLVGNVNALELNWFDKEAVHRFVAQNGFPDVILLIDCLYYDGSLWPLISALNILCSEKTVVYCGEIGTPQQVQSKFLDFITYSMNVTAVRPEEQHPDYIADDILLLRLRKRLPILHECSKLSIITPVYNGATWLQACLNSCLDQTVHDVFPNVNVELSIFDDASTDESQTIIDTFSNSVSQSTKMSVKSSKSKFSHPSGVGFAKNEAIRASTGDYLVFLDADDVMKPNRLEEIVKAIHDNGPWALYGSQFSRQPYGSTVRYTTWANKLTQEQLFTQRFTSHGPTLVAPTWCCSRVLFDAVGGFDQSKPKGVSEDMIFFFGALKLGCDLKKIEKDLVMYRYHDKCASHSVAADTMWDIRLKEFERVVLLKWDKFTIWNAGKEGRKFFRTLSAVNREKVLCFCDVDRKKIRRGFYEHTLAECDPKPKIPVVDYREAKPPFVICVKLGLTGGGLEENIKSLNLIEGVDYYHFG